MKLVKKFTPPPKVAELHIQDDVDSPWFGYAFVKLESGELLPAADLKPKMAETFAQPRKS